jgi:toxoflavin synthase
MTTNYDPIAEQYQRSKQQPWRTFVECHTLLELIGDVRGLSTIDVACGEGFYTRLLRQRGAGRTLGVDLSRGMIELAQRQELTQQLGIEYLVGDACQLPGGDPRDLAVAAYLLNYARTPDELQAMCDGVARTLRPGGRFVTVNCSASLSFPAAPSYRSYGFETRVKGSWQEGAPIEWTLHLSDSAIVIENYHLSVATHEETLRRAGFSEIRWHAPRLAPDAEPADAPFWAPLLEHSPITFIECVKG